MGEGSHVHKKKRSGQGAYFSQVEREIAKTRRLMLGENHRERKKNYINDTSFIGKEKAHR